MQEFKNLREIRFSLSGNFPANSNNLDASRRRLQIETQRTSQPLVSQAGMTATLTDVAA